MLLRIDGDYPADYGDQLALVLAEGGEDGVSIERVVVFVQHCAKNNDYDMGYLNTSTIISHPITYALTYHKTINFFIRSDSCAKPAFGHKFYY